MNTEEINERFSKLAGICWHRNENDYYFVGRGGKVFSDCSKCGCRYSEDDLPDYCANPVLVLEVMMKLGYWGENWGVIIGSMLDKTGKIALEAIKWIEENT